jgi:hypothetical protein
MYDIYKWIDNSLMTIFPDSFDRDLVVNSIFGDVVADVEETADEEFNGSDIDMAIARVLKARIVGF